MIKWKSELDKLTKEVVEDYHLPEEEAVKFTVQCVSVELLKQSIKHYSDSMEKINDWAEKRLSEPKEEEK
jgi:hypothetical protein